MKIGDEIEIINMKGESYYNGRTGVITHIDDIGQLHGTWGGLAIQLPRDYIKVIKPAELRVVK